jgi:hypothetical protein
MREELLGQARQNDFLRNEIVLEQESDEISFAPFASVAVKRFWLTAEC